MTAWDLWFHFLDRGVGGGRGDGWLSSNLFLLEEGEEGKASNLRYVISELLDFTPPTRPLRSELFLSFQ